MFWKLWKYEIKCSYRSYLFAYVVMLLAALLFTESNDVMMTLSSVLFTIMIFVTVIMTFVMVIRTFQTSMFQRTGYLTLTLPVSSKKLLLVKILNSSLWFMLSYVVIFLAAMTLAWRTGEVDVALFFEALGRAIGEMPLEGWMTLLSMLIGVIQTVTLIYLVMSLTHTNYIRHHRGLIAVILFFAISILISYINGLIFPDSALDMGFAFTIGTQSSSAMTSPISTGTAFDISMIEDAVLTVLYFFATSYILDHKLEIE